MSSSPDTSLLQRTIELNYTNKKRSSSLKWILVNGIFLLVFGYDLWGGCGDGRWAGLSTLQLVEAAVCAVAACNLLQHAASARPRRRSPLPLTPAQRRLLGLQNTKLDSSFREVSPEAEVRPEPSGRGEDVQVSPLALGREWGVDSGSRSPPSPASPQLSPYSSPSRLAQDEFIADHQALADYLRRREESETRVNEGAGWAWVEPGTGAGPSPVYQLAAHDTEGEEGLDMSGGTTGAGGGTGAGAGSPQVWRRLQLDPRRLTQFNLNLRLWIQVTILERVVREMDALDAALEAHGLSPRSVGQVGLERLRLVAGGAALLPFLAPFPDQAYVVRRYRELASGGCLSEYKWNGGGSGWDEARPADAELLLHAFTAYMDAQLPHEGGAGMGPGVGGGAFSSGHISRGGAPPRGRGVLAIHQVTRAPPHYVLACQDETLEVGAGRNNLLHVLLLFLAVCARRDPPALRRLHLGKAGLNMLWIIGR